MRRFNDSLEENGIFVMVKTHGRTFDRLVLPDRPQ